jgi:ATP phosphoribosyltransferase regulatory subunit
MRNWLLPESFEDVLPAEAARLETLRRTLLDHFAAHGYRLVHPPLVEHLESLLTGTGSDLDLQTFKVVDPLSGRLLGVRADITPQVARIDAHVLNEPGVTRLCYAGSVLRTVPAVPGASRQVLQIGAEMFGEAGIAGDREVVSLLLSSLAAAGAANASRSRSRRRLSRARQRRRISITARMAICSRRWAPKTFPPWHRSVRSCRRRGATR